jgi:hypothetical protein
MAVRPVPLTGRLADILDGVPERPKLTSHGIARKIRILRILPGGKPEAGGWRVVHVDELYTIDAGLMPMRAKPRKFQTKTLFASLVVEGGPRRENM